MDLDQLKARQATAMKVGQDLVNEQLRVEGEYRSLGKLIAELEAKSAEDSGTPVPVTVVEPTTTEADAEDGESTPAD